jgi:uncharacterized protein YdcH (DUF465 family)
MSKTTNRSTHVDTKEAAARRRAAHVARMKREKALLKDHITNVFVIRGQK